LKYRWNCRTDFLAGLGKVLLVAESFDSRLPGELQKSGELIGGVISLDDWTGSTTE
jgi:hypothetical protein